MKTKTSILSVSLTLLVVLLVIAVSSHLYSSHFGRGGGSIGGGGWMSGMGGMPAGEPIVYPPRQMPMMFGDSGNGMVWPPDVLRNPYAAPMKDDRYLVGGGPMFPINVPTNPGYVDTSYRQIGVLTTNIKDGGCKMCKKGMGKCDGSCSGGDGGRGNDDLLILMGRPLFTNRDTWQYYAISNQRNGVKLPVRVGGKNATNEYGVRELSGGDVIRVDGYNKDYQVGMYESDTIRYLPL